jgi:hypothetical protein
MECAPLGQNFAAATAMAVESRCKADWAGGIAGTSNFFQYSLLRTQRSCLLRRPLASDHNGGILPFIEAIPPPARTAEKAGPHKRFLEEISNVADLRERRSRPEGGLSMCCRQH